MSELSRELCQFAAALLELRDAVLRQEWRGRPGDEGWQDYADDLSDVAFLVYQKLRAFTVEAHVDRLAVGPALTEAQRILAQHQLAYRDFHGVMAGVRDTELDLAPVEKKWSLRQNLCHVMLAECWSQGPQVVYALERHRAGREPAPRPIRDASAENTIPQDYGGLQDLLERFDQGHSVLIQGLAGLTDRELETTSAYWEDEPVDIRFRLYRFAWHLRGHIMQAEKIRSALGHRITDTDRLVRLLYSALGEAEGALIGAGERQHRLEKAVAGAIHSRVEEVSALVHA
jgi:hypothetical protein